MMVGLFKLPYSYRTNHFSSLPYFSEPETPSDEKLPLDVLSKFNGKTREDLIKILVNHQSTIETQVKGLFLNQSNFYHLFFSGQENYRFRVIY